MKIIKYKLLTRINNGTEEAPEWVDILDEKQIHCTSTALEINETIAQREAYNGEYTIEDDGIEEVVTPTTEERVEALEAAVTMLCMPDVSEV